MKKNLILGLAIAALAFTACSKNDISENLDGGRKLNFRVVSGKTTKGVTEKGNSDIETAATLDLYAYDKDSVAYKFQGYDDNKVTLNYLSEWTPMTDIILSSSANYAIKMYSVFDPSNTAVITGTDKLKFKYKIDYAAGTNVEHDLLVGSATIADKDVTTTQIQYTHALAQVIVTLKYTNQRPGTYAKIENCYVSAFDGELTYTFAVPATDLDPTINEPSLTAEEIKTKVKDNWGLVSGRDAGNNSNTALVEYVDATSVRANDDGTAKELGRFIYFPQKLDGIAFKWGIYYSNGDPITGSYGNGTSGTAATPDYNNYTSGDYFSLNDAGIVISAGNIYYLDIIIDGATVQSAPSLKFTVGANGWEPGTNTPVIQPTPIVN